jgi:hypothetical protein
MYRLIQNLVGEGEVLVIPIPVKRVPERCCSLRPSEKELPEWRSGTYQHKNTMCIFVSGY